MHNNIFGSIIALLLLGFWVLAIVGMIARAVKHKYAPLKTIKAVVIDKHKEESFSKYSGNGKRERCVVVFSAQGEELSFYVSEFSFGGYEIGEKGMLTYKGDKIIEFK